MAKKAKKNCILLTPASKMTWSDPSRHKHGMVRDLHSPSEEKRFKIYTPGEKVPIMTTAVNHAVSAPCEKK